MEYPPFNIIISRVPNGGIIDLSGSCNQSVIDHRMLAAFEMQCSLLPYPWRKE